jgi:hypothetical protein
MFIKHDNILYTIDPKKLAHNILAICDVLPARIRALRSKDQGWSQFCFAKLLLAMHPGWSQFSLRPYK